MHEGQELPPESPKGARRLYTVGGLLLLSMVMFTVLLWHNRETATASERESRADGVKAGPQVLVAKVLDNTTGRVVALPGDVRPLKGVTLYAKTSGYLKEIKVDKGDTVKEGQVLGVVESPETDQQVLSVQADMVVKRQTEERYRGLVGSGVVSQQEMDKATADLQAAEAELARLHAFESVRSYSRPVQRYNHCALR